MSLRDILSNFIPALGSLSDSAAADDPTSADTAIAYLKQIVNNLQGTDGITAWPGEAAPANGVSIAEVLEAIHADVTGLNGAAMAGTSNAALAIVLGALADAAATGAVTTNDTAMAYIKQIVTAIILIEADTNELQVDWVNGGRLDLLLDALQTDLSNGTDGLGALKTLIDAVNTDLGNGTDGLGALKTLLNAIPTTMVGTDNAALATVLEDAMQKATGPAFDQDTDSLEAIRELLDAMAGYIDTEVAAILLDTGTDGVVVNSRTQAAERLVGVPQVFTKSITAAANAGIVTVATVNINSVVIDSVILHANAAQTGDLTSAAIEGGNSQVVEFISAALAIQANLDAADKQVSGDKPIMLVATRLITIDLQGGGATAVNLTVTINYHAVADGANLS